MNKGLILPCQEEYAGYLRDESRQSGQAESISFPRSEEEIAALLRFASARRMRITVQGGRTGVSAGAVPRGGLILNLSRMCGLNGISWNADGSFLLRVQPGLTLDALRKMLAGKQLNSSRFDAASLAVAREFELSPAQFFSPDPTETTATLGGMAACNASGAKSFRYGPMRRHIEALRLMLIDGDMLVLKRGGCRARGRRLQLTTEAGREILLPLPHYQMPRVKNASGYYIEDDMDAVDLFIGSDGSLGVITELTLKLLPLPRTIWGATFFFTAEEQTVAMVNAVRSSLPSLAAIEYFGSGAPGISATENPGGGSANIAAIEYFGSGAPGISATENPGGGSANIAAIEYFGSGALKVLGGQRQKGAVFSQLPEVHPRFAAALYLELHTDTPAQALEGLTGLAAAARAAGGHDEDSWVARTAAERERLLLFRHAIPESVNMLIDGRRRQCPGIGKLSTDMSVPDAALAEVMALYRDSLSRAGLQSAVWGHIGDNHLHVNILPRDLAEYERGQELYGEWAEIITRLGGAVSAEHGVGKLKAPFLAIMYGEENVRAMAALKAALDPLCLLGAETMFPAEYVLAAGG